MTVEYARTPVKTSGDVVARFIYATRLNVPDLIIKGDNTYRVITDYLSSPRMVVNEPDRVLGCPASRLRIVVSYSPPAKPNG